MKCLNCSSLSGNQSVAYQGFAIDLLDAISKVSIKTSRVNDISLFLCGDIQVAGFHYSLYLVPDNLYGVFDHETKEWNGIVRQELFHVRLGYWTKVYLIKEIKIKLNNRNFQGADRQKGRYSGCRNDHQLCQVFCQFVDSIGPIDCTLSILPIAQMSDKSLISINKCIFLSLSIE